MRKFNFAKIISFVFICAVLVGALAIAAFATEETPTVEIAAHNVYYGDSFHIMYAVKAPAGATITAVDTEGENVKVVPFKDPDSGATTVTLNGVVYDMYITEAGVAAQALDEVITLTVKAGDEVATNAYSVLQYTYERKQDLADATSDADVKELAMLNALVEYADAANAFMPEEDEVVVPFGSYVYVTVEGATVNGVNPTGMYVAGATPFANLELALDYDEANQILRWYADDVLTDLDAIKAIVVADKNIAVKAVVLDKCFDGHTMIAPTCQKDGYCDVCGTAGDPKVNHKDENGDYKCDFGCGTIVTPAADEALSLVDANKLGMAFANGTYTADKYYVTGVITAIDGATFGNIYIKDDAGNTFYLYGLYSADGSVRYDAMDYKPVPGDEITVWGVIGTYNGKEAQMKNAWLDEVVKHEHNYSEANCNDPATCTLCGFENGEALGHTEANAEGKCDRCGVDLEAAAKEVTVTMAYPGGSTTNMTGNNDATKVGLDASIFSVIGNKGGTANNCGLNTAGQIRLYCSKSNGNGSYFTVSIAEGYTIKSIKITLGGTVGKLQVTDATGAVLGESSTKNDVLEYDVNGDSFKLQNVKTGDNVQVYILSIEITYAPN